MTVFARQRAPRRALDRSAARDEEREWISAARRGDRTAFARLYERFAPVVHSVLLARVAPPDAEDLVQEVFIVAWRKLDSLRDAAALGGWLCAIARNRAEDLVHDRNRDAAMRRKMPRHGPRMDLNHETEVALSAIRELPEPYREPLILRWVEGLSGPEIAARTGLTEGSVRVNLHRGMALLRARLAPQAGR